MYITYNNDTKQFAFVEHLKKQKKGSKTVPYHHVFVTDDEDDAFTISIFDDNVFFDDRDHDTYLEDIQSHVDETLTDAEPAVVTVTEFSLPKCESIVCTKTTIRGRSRGNLVELEFYWYEFNMVK